MLIEAPLHEAQLFLIIGRQDLWLHHFGSAALLELLDVTFTTYKLHRAWVDVPDYNIHARHMCERLGFLLEGHLRSTHPKDGEWYDSTVMGLLEREYFRRRPRLMEEAKVPRPGLTHRPIRLTLRQALRQAQDRLRVSGYASGQRPT